MDESKDQPGLCLVCNHGAATCFTVVHRVGLPDAEHDVLAGDRRAPEQGDDLGDHQRPRGARVAPRRRQHAAVPLAAARQRLHRGNVTVSPDPGENQGEKGGSSDWSGANPLVDRTPNFALAEFK